MLLELCRLLKQPALKMFSSCTSEPAVLPGRFFRLPGFFSAFPRVSQWRARKRRLYPVYGGGSALALNEIPYQAPRGALLSRLSQTRVVLSNVLPNAGVKQEGCARSHLSRAGESACLFDAKTPHTRGFRNRGYRGGAPLNSTPQTSRRLYAGR